MPHLATDHSAKIALTFRHAVVPIKAEMTFAVRDTTDAIFAVPSTFANQVYASAIAHLGPALTPEVVLNGVVFEDVRVLPYGGADFPQADHPGTNGASGGLVPTDGCIAIKKVTDGLGRAARGRLFWPIWNASLLVTADTTSAAVVSAIVTALVAFQTALETGPLVCELGIISQQVGGVVRGSGLFERITSYSAADLFIDSQRRRLLGRGT